MKFVVGDLVKVKINDVMANIHAGDIGEVLDINGKEVLLANTKWDGHDGSLFREGSCPKEYLGHCWWVCMGDVESYKNSFLNFLQDIMKT